MSQFAKGSERLSFLAGKELVNITFQASCVTLSFSDYSTLKLIRHRYSNIDLLTDVIMNIEKPRQVCKWCSKPVDLAGSKECNFCWELRSKAEMRPHLAQRITTSVLDAIYEKG